MKFCHFVRPCYSRFRSAIGRFQVPFKTVDLGTFSKNVLTTWHAPMRADKQMILKKKIKISEFISEIFLSATTDNLFADIKKLLDIFSKRWRWVLFDETAHERKSELLIKRSERFLGRERDTIDRELRACPSGILDNASTGNRYSTRLRFVTSSNPRS